MEIEESDLFGAFDEKDNKKDQKMIRKKTKRDPQSTVESIPSKKRNVNDEVSKGMSLNDSKRDENKEPAGIDDLVKSEIPEIDDMIYEDENIKAEKMIENKIKQIFAGDENMNDNDLAEDLNIQVETFEFQGCIHENIRSKDSQGLVKSTTPPAKEYEFTLDKFQERAILCLENQQSVLVAAHTSAGKTAVAQYAIAMALRDHQRVIYTSPIKALSNQKYRELLREFKDVGLMTGDVTISPSAGCIVMTTEILRNMLYKGSEITREMAWVIFDEVHYMRDKERGVVWEETIILLSNKIKYVFLSATIPNAREFAMWICKLKSQPCNVVYTDFRPVPLQHYVYVSGSDSIYLAVDHKGNFKEQNFNNAISLMNEDLLLDKVLDKNSRFNHNKKEEADIKKIITLIKEYEMDPAIVFSFSKKECEINAMTLSKMDLTTEEEKDLIEKIYTSAISTLSEDDQALPQIQMMLPLLKKGIGIHHGGLLPIVKECVELIFQEGMIKTLFSTETFSLGINMPAKTVVFTSIEKYDGDEFRWISGGEYIQMSGRAGRRGIDDKGFTIIMLDKKMDPEVCKSILYGKADPLNSTFHLGYNQLVNLMRVEGMECEYIVKRSFHQFQAVRSLPQMKSLLMQLYKEYKAISLSTEKERLIKDKLSIELQKEKLKEEIRKIVALPENCIPYLIPGRLIKFHDFDWGICINFTKRQVELTMQDKQHKLSSQVSQQIENESEIYIIDTLVYVKNLIDPNKKILPGNLNENDGQFGVIPFISSGLESLSSIKLNIPKDLKDKRNLKNVEKIFRQVFKKFKNGIPELDPIKDMEIANPKLSECRTKIYKFDQAMENLKGEAPNPALEISATDGEIFNEKANLKTKITNLIENIHKMNELVLKDDLKNMKRVLRRLEFISDDIVLAKGQVACIISSGDEILITEMLFNGSFNDIEPTFLAAMLSCFLSNEGSSSTGEEKIAKNELLTTYHNKITENAGRVADVLIECRIQIDKTTYINGFKNDYMKPVFEWVNGAKFADVCLTTDIYEGSLIRCMRRLDELIKQLSESSQLIGNFNLKEKLDKASELLKRGIVFAASLYLTSS